LTVPIPAEFANFDIAAANVTVWLFKKSGGANGQAPTFTGRWIDVNGPLEAALKEAVTVERDRVEEVIEYGLLAQNHENSVLEIGLAETHADLIAERVQNPLPQNRVKSEKQIQNTSFYVVKFSVGGDCLMAVRKADSSWRTKRRRDVIDFVFQNESLALDEDPTFSLSKHVDFFIIGDKILIANKGHFESVLNYRQAHADDFLQLQVEPEFTAIFADVAPLVAYVGANKIQLRRACAIRQKGHYKDDEFLERLRQNYMAAKLVLEFDGAGLLIPTAETCSNIITALLDHRLISVFSENIYDVQNVAEVG
jgi:hypothetical protein